MQSSFDDVIRIITEIFEQNVKKLFHAYLWQQKITQTEWLSIHNILTLQLPLLASTLNLNFEPTPTNMQKFRIYTLGNHSFFDRKVLYLHYIRICKEEFQRAQKIPKSIDIEYIFQSYPIIRERISFCYFVFIDNFGLPQEVANMIIMQDLQNLRINISQTIHKLQFISKRLHNYHIDAFNKLRHQQEGELTMVQKRASVSISYYFFLYLHNFID